MLDELIDAGDQVIAVHHQRGLGASSERGGGAARQGIIFTLRGGATVRVEIYGDPEKARAVAGLRE